jgi:hypothetical protein
MDNTPAYAERDAGIFNVTINNKEWMRQALLKCMEWRLAALRDARPSNFLSEDLRNALAPIIGEPSHHNAWGALTRVLADKNIIEPTGAHRPMKSRTSHARMTPSYRWVSL